jgi:hypothetical protein
MDWLRIVCWIVRGQGMLVVGCLLWIVAVYLLVPMTEALPTAVARLGSDLR